MVAGVPCHARRGVSQKAPAPARPPASSRSPSARFEVEMHRLLRFARPPHAHALRGCLCRPMSHVVPRFASLSEEDMRYVPEQKRCSHRDAKKCPPLASALSAVAGQPSILLCRARVPMPRERRARRRARAYSGTRDIRNLKRPPLRCLFMSCRRCRAAFRR